MMMSFAFSLLTIGNIGGSPCNPSTQEAKADHFKACVGNMAVCAPLSTNHCGCSAESFRDLFPLLPQSCSSL